MVGQVWTIEIMGSYPTKQFGRIWTHKVMLGRVLKQSAGGLVKFPKGFICAILPTLYIVSYSCVAALHTNGKPSAPLLIRVFIVLRLMGSITPNFPSTSNREITGDYIEKHYIGPPLFTLLQPKMMTDVIISGWCDQPLTLKLICWMTSWSLTFRALDCKPSFGGCDLRLGFLGRCFIYFDFRHFACDSWVTSAWRKAAREAAKLFNQSSRIPGSSSLHFSRLFFW